MSRPAKRTLPFVGRIMPITIFTVVDLPEPFGPRYPSTSPAFNTKLTFSTAGILR